MEKEKKAGKIISNIILVIAIAVFMYSAYNLYMIFSEYKEGEDTYESIKEQVVMETQTPLGDNMPEQFSVDFEKLLEINSDVVGWIRFDEPADISYPIAQGETNNTYLRTTLEKKKNSAGTIFIDYQNQSDFTDKNTFIYGHNMKNGTMFGQLRKYKDAEFGKQYPYFYIYTPDGREIKYEIFSVSVVDTGTESYQMFYESDSDFENYIKYIKSKSLYSFDVNVSSASRIASLSTCTNVTDEQRLLVHGVVVSERIIKE